jgi:deoxyribose-phosphate aldolase
MTSQNVLVEGSRLLTPLDWRTAARLIDHTLLLSDATHDQVSTLCAEAAKFGFFSVMVNPCNVAQCVNELRGTEVVVGSVVGFPLGATTSGVKLSEALDVLKLGAREVDMVINIGALKSGERDMVRSEMHALVNLCHAHGAKLKAILEMGSLTTEEKIVACQLSAIAGVDFVKTSTGFAASGATVNDVHLMRGVVGQAIGVKASGGIRNAGDLMRMVEAGANRIGTSVSVAIVRELGAPTEF